MMDTEQEYDDAPEELKLKFAEYLDKWFKENKYTDSENNPLTFHQWKFEMGIFDTVFEG